MKIKKQFIFTLPLLFLLGSLSHFVYDWLGKNPIIGLFFPINESIYEHTKLAIIPLLLFYIYYGMKNKPNFQKWLTTFVISLLVTMFLIPVLYYFYTGAFGFESTIIDILIYFVSITCGQLLALHVYLHSKKSIDIKLNLLLLGTLFVVNIMFTVQPPRLPLFFDEMCRCYGMKK